jgi:outer membrane lipoprotein-sorting protein
MNADGSPDPADMVTNLVKAFEAMPVPAAPARHQTIDALNRATASAIVQEEPGGEKRASTRGRSRLARLTIGQRVAVGGIGLSTVAVLAWLAILSVESRQLSAMERMARHLREVKSYRYTVTSETTTAGQDPNRQTTWRESGRSFWRAPDAFRGEIKIVKIESADGGREPGEEVLEDFVEIFPPGRMGIFIDHKRKTFFRCRYDPIGSTTYPLEPLKLIREDNPPRTRDLGTRQIDGKSARGYLVPLTTGHPPRRHDWQVWLDPATDLPLEISYEVDDRKKPRTTTVLRVGDFRWNEEPDPKLFDATQPAGYREVPPPKLEPGESSSGRQ